MNKLTMEDVRTPEPWEIKAAYHKHRGVKCCSCADQLSMAKVEAGEVQCSKCEQAAEHRADQERYRREQAEEEKRVRVEEVVETLRPILMDIYDLLYSVFLADDSKLKVEIKLAQLKDKLENL